MQDQDPRVVLGLPLDANWAEAQRAFRRLAKQTHPDAGGDPAAFRAVTDAWAELCATLPCDRRRPVPSPYAQAYRVAVSRVVWTEARPPTRPTRPARPDFATLLRVEMTRLAA